MFFGLNFTIRSLILNPPVIVLSTVSPLKGYIFTTLILFLTVLNVFLFLSSSSSSGFSSSSNFVFDFS